MPDYLAGWREQMLQATQVAQGIRQAAMQQQELDETKRSNSFSQALRGREMDLSAAAQAQKTQHDNLVDQLSALNSGGTGVTTGDDGNNYVAGPAAGSPGAGPTVPGAVGITQQMTAPPVNPGRVVSAGGKQMYIPTADEAASANLTRSLQARRAEMDQTAMPLPNEVQSTLYPDATSPMSVQPGAMPAMSQLYQDVTNRRERAAAATTAANAKTAPPPEEVSHVIESYGKGGTYVTPVFKSGKVGDTVLRPGGPAGAMRGGDGGAAGGGVQGRFNQKQMDAMEQLHNAKQVAEKQNWALVKEYDDAASEPDTETTDSKGVAINPGNPKVTDPGSGKDVPMNAARRKYFQDQSAAARASAMQMQINAAQLRRTMGTGEFAPEASAERDAAQAQAAKNASGGVAAAPAPQQSAAPAAATPGAQTQPAAGGTVRVKTGAGQVGSMPAANLKKAQALDPKLQVLP